MKIIVDLRETTLARMAITVQVHISNTNSRWRQRSLRFYICSYHCRSAAWSIDFQQKSWYFAKFVYHVGNFRASSLAKALTVDDSIRRTRLPQHEQIERSQVLEAKRKAQKIEDNRNEIHRKEEREVSAAEIARKMIFNIETTPPG